MESLLYGMFTFPEHTYSSVWERQRFIATYSLAMPMFGERLYEPYVLH